PARRPRTVGRRAICVRPAARGSPFTEIGQKLDATVAIVRPPCQVFVKDVYSDRVEADVGALRIGEFARRAGVSPELLRAWERRDGLLQPIRTERGFRLYTGADAERVARMRQGLEEGLSAAE